MAMVAMTGITPFFDAFALRDRPLALRQRAQEDGYLYLSGLIDPDAIDNVRRQVLDLCDKHGWLDRSYPLMEGIRKKGVTLREADAESWRAFYRDMLRVRDFHALSLSPPLMDVLEKLFGEPALAHSRNICRVMFPDNNEYTTPPHQDHLYIGGTQETWTAWIPLGDVPEELGGLALAAGTHRQGFLDPKPAKGAGGRQVTVEEDIEWSGQEMRCGDVLLFHSLLIHQGRDTTTPDRLRLSVDYRYQPISHPVRKDSLEPHMGGFGQTWDDIYRDWAQDDPLKYYWKRMGLNIVDA